MIFWVQVAFCVIKLEILNWNFVMGMVERVARASNGRTVSAEFLINGTFLCACICCCWKKSM